MKRSPATSPAAEVVYDVEQGGTTIDRRRFGGLYQLGFLALLLPAAIACLGLLCGQWVTVDVASESGGYAYVTHGLLAVGLYGSVHGISIPEARRDVRRIVVAVTFGVVLKAALIMAVLTAVFRNEPKYLVLAVAMAQIDPLSVSVLLENRDMSPRAKSLLAAWASFDDPVTTILVVLVSSMVFTDPGGGMPDVGAYVGTFGGNLALLLAAAVTWAAVRGRGSAAAGPAGGAAEEPVTRRRHVVQIIALVALLAVATWQFLMLGIALAALFFRPELGPWVRRTTNAALFVATFLLGLLLSAGIDITVGLVLGAATFAAQIVVAFFVSWGLPRGDRIALCLSQQNGITAIILALLLQPDLPEAVAIVAPAIATVNVLHLLAGSLSRWMLPRDSGDVAGPPA
ncbi:hypothetical protein OG216_39595 [Streptomycetaceae bacterium NBC_01309]